MSTRIISPIVLQRELNAHVPKLVQSMNNRVPSSTLALFFEYPNNPDAPKRIWENTQDEAGSEMMEAIVAIIAILQLGNSLTLPLDLRSLKHHPAYRYVELHHARLISGMCIHLASATFDNAYLMVRSGVLRSRLTPNFSGFMDDLYKKLSA